jgi:hypothetical protein
VAIIRGTPKGALRYEYGLKRYFPSDSLYMYLIACL